MNLNDNDILNIENSRFFDIMKLEHGISSARELFQRERIFDGLLFRNFKSINDLRVEMLERTISLNDIKIVNEVISRKLL